MKLNLILAAAAAVVLTASCGILGAGPAATPAPEPSVQTGKSAGTALAGLYKQYKADGKVDLTNINNIVNIATVATNAKGLNSQEAKSALVTDFVTGMILGSNNLVNKNNSTGVVDNLKVLSGINTSSITNAAAAIAASTAANALGAANTAATNAAAAATTAATTAVTNTATAAQDLSKSAINAINKINTTSTEALQTVNTLSNILGMFKQ